MSLKVKKVVSAPPRAAVKGKALKVKKVVLGVFTATKEDPHVTHLSESQDPEALEAAQILYRERPEETNLSSMPSSNSP